MQGFSLGVSTETDTTSRTVSLVGAGVQGGAHLGRAREAHARVRGQ